MNLRDQHKSSADGFLFHLFRDQIAGSVVPAIAIHYVTNEELKMHSKIIFVLLLCVLGSVAAQAQHQHPKTPSHGAHGAHNDNDVDTPVSKMNIPDVELLDQNGKKVHFYTDLVKGQTVVINFIFTTCTTICPPLGATFARVQKELGDRAGRDVSFISISVDPATDTPERLKAGGSKIQAGDGKTFVTGTEPDLDT